MSNRLFPIRWMAAFWATFRGYFWLPCPLCSRMFAGFETADSPLMDTPRSGRGVCWECGDRARAITLECYAAWKENK